MPRGYIIICLNSFEPMTPPEKRETVKVLGSTVYRRYSDALLARWRAGMDQPLQIMRVSALTPEQERRLLRQALSTCQRLLQRMNLSRSHLSALLLAVEARAKDKEIHDQQPV